MHTMLNAFCSRILPAVALGMSLSFGLSLEAAATSNSMITRWCQPMPTCRCSKDWAIIISP
jgi:hypothetical protein